MSASARLRESLTEGHTLLGTFLKVASSEIVDIVASAGFDFAVADGEHSQLADADLRMLTRHARAIGLPLLVRIPAVDAGLVNRVLEAGAAGIQLSTLRSASQRDQLIEATRYRPNGSRSISLAHPAGGYGAIPIVDYLALEEASPPLLVGQVETASTQESLTEIIRGLDVVFVGTLDLSVDMGYPGGGSHPEVEQRISELANATGDAGLVLGGWAPNGLSLPVLTGMGARYLVVGSDLQIASTGISELVRAAREAIG